MTITPNDLIALLNDARQELAVLASYVDDPEFNWPTLGLKTTAKAHKSLVERIDNWMTEPVEDFPLRQENFALRAALAVRDNDEEWRLRYLEAEAKRINALKKAEAHKREIKRLRDGLEGVVNLCRLGCTEESNCGMCARALRALRGEA